MKKNVQFWIVLSICFLLLLSSILFYRQHQVSNAHVQTYSTTLTDAGFDTPIMFQATCTKKEFDTYVSIVKDMYQENNKRFDQYHEYEGINNVYTINHIAYDQPVEIDDILLDCITLSLKYNQVNTQFDITQGALLSLWHTYREDTKNKVPSKKLIQEALHHGGRDTVQIDGNTVRLLDQDASLDLGGIAKGYTTQMVADRLQNEGLRNGFINAGGNVVTLGPKADHSPWVIGIQNPDGNDSLLTYSTKDAQAIVTSGDYQRYYEVQGKRYHHIIDFQTGYPSQYARSVTVFTSDSAKADALSTMLFSMSYEDGFALAKQEGVDVCWIFDKDNRPSKDATFEKDGYFIYCTKGIEANLE